MKTRFVVTFILMLMNEGFLRVVVVAGGGGGDETSSSKSSTGDHYYPSVDPLYFLFTALLLGAITLYVQKKYLWFLPYTPLMFLVGMCLGLAHAANSPMGYLDQSIDAWLAIDPHLLLTIFLPALVFADAMKMNIHLFRKCLIQCIILAGPGTLLSAFGVGAVAFYFFPSFGSHWDWNLCMVFGSALAATDPVSVVNMLESVNGPPKLTMIMSGESHLADLTSYVMFNIFLGLITGKLNNAQIGNYAVAMVIGGPLLGFLFGYIALWGIRRNIAPQRNSDVMIQITLTISAAYLSFIVSENVLSGNGIVATVCAALVIAHSAWPSFASIETIENVWHAVEFFGNTLIFCLAGLMFGDIFYGIIIRSIRPEVIVEAIITWAFVYIIRAGIVLIFLPFLRKLGYGFPVHHAPTLWFGGLRGAVAMALGIVVRQSVVKVYDDPKFKKEELNDFFFIVGFVVMMSLLINQVCTPLLMKVTKVLSRTNVKKQLLHHVKDRLEKRANENFEHHTHHHSEFETVPREVVSQIVTSLRLFDLHHKNEPAVVETEKLNGSFQHQEHSTSNDLLLQQVRELFLDALKGAYWEQIEEGILPRQGNAAQYLLESCELAKDKTDTGLCDFTYLSLPTELEDDQKALHERIFDCIDKSLPEWVTIDDYFGEKLHAQYRQEAVYIATCFITGHERAQARIAEYVGEGEEADSPEEVAVINESNQEIAKAKQYLKVAEARDPHIVELIKAKKVASILLQHQTDIIDELVKQGIIDGRTTLELKDIVRKDTLKVKKLEAVPRKNSKSLRVDDPKVDKKISISLGASTTIQDPAPSSSSFKRNSNGNDEFEYSKD